MQAASCSAGCCIMAPCNAGTLPPQWASNDFWPSLSQLAISTNVTGSLPAAWSDLDAFQSLTVLDLSNNQLVGSLPVTWPAQLDTLILNNNNFSGSLSQSGWPAQLRVPQMILNRLTGTISPNFSVLQRLQMLRLDENMLTGHVLEAWGAADAFPGGLTVLTLFNNQLTATLYNSWGSAHAFTSLQLLSLNGMGIGGTLPDSWGSTLGAFRFLRILYLGSVNMVGTIPASWGSTQGFPSLECLWLDDSVVRGMVPAFDNVNLAILILSNTSLTSDLNAFWGSSAPLTRVDLSYSYIEGYLQFCTRCNC